MCLSILTNERIPIYFFINFDQLENWCERSSQTSTICAICKIILQAHPVKCLFDRHIWMKMPKFDFELREGTFRPNSSCRHIFRLWRPGLGKAILQTCVTQSDEPGRRARFHCCKDVDGVFM